MVPVLPLYLECLSLPTPLLIYGAFYQTLFKSLLPFHALTLSFSCPDSPGSFWLLFALLSLAHRCNPAISLGLICGPIVICSQSWSSVDSPAVSSLCSVHHPQPLCPALSPYHLNLRSCYDLFHGHPPSQFSSLADHLSPPSVNLPEASSHHTLLSFKNVSGTPSLVCISSLNSCLLVLRLCRGRISRPLSTKAQFPGQWGDPWRSRGRPMG